MWIHVVCSVDNTIQGPGGLKIYLDSSEAGSSTSAGLDFTLYSNAAYNYFIGTRNLTGTPDNAFTGGIDNFVLFARDLTPAEIAVLYNSGKGTENIPCTFNEMNFDLDQVVYKGAEIPQTSLRFSNVTQFIKADLEANRGCTNSDLIIRCVHANQLYEDYSALDINFSVLYPRITRQFVEFMLGGPSPLKRRVPPDRYFADACRYVDGFKTDPRCGYAGGETACSGLRSRCRELSNETNFGGFPGLRAETLRLA